MSSIKDDIRIDATPRRAYEALTRQADYRGWWSARGEVDENVGGDARLVFDKDGAIVRMRFRIDAMQPDQSVRWTCVDHDFGDWIGTTLDWTVEKDGGGVRVKLDHAGWKGDVPGPVAQGWKHFLGSLKSYIETGTGQPW